MKPEEELELLWNFLKEQDMDLDAAIFLKKKTNTTEPKYKIKPIIVTYKSRNNELTKEL